MSYEETVKEIENTFGMLPGFMRNTPKRYSSTNVAFV